MELSEFWTTVLGACLMLVAALLANYHGACSRWRRMMRAAVLSALAFVGSVLFLAPLKAAEPPTGTIFVLNAPNGAIVYLHDAKEDCAQGLKATWVSPNRKEIILGCYTVDADALVHVDWSDGDQNIIPLRAFRRPTGV